MKTLYYTSIFAMKHKKLFADDKITALFQTNMSPKHYKHVTSNKTNFIEFGWRVDNV